MKARQKVFSLIAGTALMVFGATGVAAAADQVGATGKTYASGAATCAVNPVTAQPAPVVQAGLLNPKRGVSATVSLNGAFVATVTTTSPSTNVWLADGATNTVTVALSRRSADSYTFTVPAGMCTADTSHNTFSTDGTLEYGASGKSYATVTPGCAFNGATGRTQPYVNLFDSGTYLLNVSVNGVPLTQLSATRPHTPVFLSAGPNLITAANGSLSVDAYQRDGGDGTCVLA